MLTPNEKRMERGSAAIMLHPDYASGSIDCRTAATDLIADILHLFGRSGDVDGILNDARDTFYGDFDDPDNYRAVTR